MIVTSIKEVGTIFTMENKPNIIKFELPNDDVNLIEQYGPEYLLAATKISRGETTTAFEYEPEEYRKLQMFMVVAGYKQPDGSWDYNSPDWSMVNRFEDMVDSLYDQVVAYRRAMKEVEK
jgi:hypothetical protein